MASKYSFVIMALCVAQVAHPAVGVKRGLLDSIPLVGPLIQQEIDKVTKAISNYTNDVLSSLAGGVIQAEKIVQNYTDQATAVNEASKGPLQDLLKSVIDNIKSAVNNEIQYGLNSTLCVLGQRESAEKVVEQAAKDIFSCTQATIKEPFDLLVDIKNLNDQGIQLVGNVPSEVFKCVTGGLSNVSSCVLNLISSTISKSLLLSSSQVQDGYSLLHTGVHLPGKLAKCATDETLEATAKVGRIITDIGECIKKLAQNS